MFVQIYTSVSTRNRGASFHPLKCYDQYFCTCYVFFHICWKILEEVPLVTDWRMVRNTIIRQWEQSVDLTVDNQLTFINFLNSPQTWHHVHIQHRLFKYFTKLKKLSTIEQRSQQTFQNLLKSLSPNTNTAQFLHPIVMLRQGWKFLAGNKMAVLMAASGHLITNRWPMFGVA